MAHEGEDSLSEEPQADEEERQHGEGRGARAQRGDRGGRSSHTVGLRQHGDDRSEGERRAQGGRPDTQPVDPHARSRQQSGGGERPEEVGVREREPAEARRLEQGIGEDAHSHRLAGDAEEHPGGGRGDDDPAVEEGHAPRGEGDVGG